MTAFSIVHVSDYEFDELIMLRKNRPDWQAGKLNLPGGHIEDGELPCQAAARELYEETGLIAKSMPQAGTIYCGEHSIHVFHARGVNGEPEQMTDEVVEKIPFHRLYQRNDLVDYNIVILHGLIMNSIYGWDLFHHEQGYEIQIPRLHT